MADTTTTLLKKKLNTRICLKYDTFTNWNTNNPTLLPGELAVVSLTDVTSTTAGASAGTTGQHPVLFKIGPGNFKDLPWASALAADVHDWAKCETVSFNTANQKIEFKVGTTVKHDIDLSSFVTADEAAALISASESTTAGNLSSAISALETKLKGGSTSQTFKALEQLISNKANSTDVYTTGAADAKFATLANTYTRSEVDEKDAATSKLVTDLKNGSTSTIKALDEEIAKKANSADVYTKNAADAKFATIATTYTQDQANAAFAPKSTTYSKSEVDGAISSAVLAARGTTTETVASVNTKVTNITKDATITTFKGIEGELAKKANAATTYSKTEVDGLIEDAVEGVTGGEGSLGARVSALETTSATKNELDLAKQALLGTASDDADAATIAGAKKYADDKVAALVNGAPEALDTLDELAAALKDNKDIVSVLEESIGKKLAIADFNSFKSGDFKNVSDKAHTHTNKAELDKIASGDKQKWDTAAGKAHEHANKAALDEFVTGDHAKIESNETRIKALEDLDEIIFYCGTSNTNLFS